MLDLGIMVFEYRFVIEKIKSPETSMNCRV